MNARRDQISRNSSRACGRLPGRPTTRRSTSLRTATARAPAAVIGVRLKPYAARAFLRAGAEKATDRRLDLARLHGAAATALAAQARAARGVAAAASIAEDYVAGCLAGARIDAGVRAATDAMFADAEPVPPDDISERQWQRRFKAEIGVSPRMLQTVLRFRRVFDAIEHPETSGWVEAALRAGYFDQPQMARDFRRFLGCTAREWAAQKAGLAKALIEPR